ncbi:MAG TPA: hypothetical protein VHE30_20170 [Polyangiaceae bacterium]|nr:hypothetical protein [Polyangiaceae bacterium]
MRSVRWLGAAARVAVLAYAGSAGAQGYPPQYPPAQRTPYPQPYPQQPRAPYPPPYPQQPYPQQPQYPQQRAPYPQQPYPQQPYPQQPYPQQPQYPQQRAPYPQQPQYPQQRAPYPPYPQPPQQPQYPQQRAPYPQQPYPQQRAPYPQQPYPQQPYPQPYPGQPGYPAVLPTEAPNPLLDAQQRYHQQLGAYQRSYVLPPPDPRAQRTSYVRLVSRSKHHHDGFYFRFAGGVGLLHDAAKSDKPLPSKADFPFEKIPFDGSGGSTAGATELSLGYTLGSGLALGVGVFTGLAPSSTLDVTDTNTGSYDMKATQLAVIGVLGDWYFFPDRGFHAQVSPGLATLVAGAGQPENTDAAGNLRGPQAQAHTAIGFGFMLGVGYDFWVSDEWSLGVLGRFLYGSSSGSDDRGVSWTHSTYVPALLLGATYN